MTTAGSNQFTITERIHQYRVGTLAWDDLARIVATYPWRDPDLPPSNDWNAWDPAPDTFRAGTFGEVTGAHVDEALTDEENEKLLEAFMGNGEYAWIGAGPPAH